MFNYSPLAWYFALAWIWVGFLTYYLYARSRDEQKSRTPVLLDLPRPAAFKPVRPVG